jgi:hypothetical protein
MDREEALRLLNGGDEDIKEWNRRRKEGEEIPDLSGANLQKADLSFAKLQEAWLSYANVREAKLKGTNLESANLRDVGNTYPAQRWARTFWLFPPVYQMPFKLDDTRTRNTCFEHNVADPWSILRRTYTGPNMVFVLLFTLLAFAPLVA